MGMRHDGAHLNWSVKWSEIFTRCVVKGRIQKVLYCGPHRLVVVNHYINQIVCESLPLLIILNQNGKKEAPSEKPDGNKLDRVSMLKCSMHWQQIRMQKSAKCCFSVINAGNIEWPNDTLWFTLRTPIHITLCYHWRATMNDRRCFSFHRVYMNRLAK